MKLAVERVDVAFVPVAGFLGEECLHLHPCQHWLTVIAVNSGLLSLPRSRETPRCTTSRLISATHSRVPDSVNFSGSLDR